MKINPARRSYLSISSWVESDSRITFLPSTNSFAFADAGNGSVTNVTLSPEEETALLTGTPIASEETVANNEEGTVLGTVDTVKSFLQKSWLPLGLGLIGLFAIIRYALRKRKKF